jgi:hypothetical protein
MGFTITYRDPRFPGLAGLSIVASELHARAALERLRREGYEITSTEPRLARVPMERRAALENT